MNDDTKPTLAAGMAKRSFWIAVAGGWTGMICRWELVGGLTQALLMMLTPVLLLIATVFGAVALIRIRPDDRKAVLIPALAGLLLGLALLANITYWARDHWLQARLRASRQATQASQANETLPVPSLQRAQTASPKSTIKYGIPALNEIPQAAADIRAGAARATGDDAAAMRAWAAHLEKLHFAYTNTLAGSNRLHEVDLLDPKLVTNLGQNEPVRRRGLANRYFDAWHAVGERLSTFTGSYYEDLREARVSSERSSVEVQALSAALEQPDTAARVAALRKLCAAEEAVGNHYNYAVSAVFDYALIASRMSKPTPGLNREMDERVAKLNEKKQAAADARREVFSAPGGDSRQGEARAGL